MTDLVRTDTEYEAMFSFSEFLLYIGGVLDLWFGLTFIGCFDHIKTIPLEDIVDFTKHFDISFDENGYSTFTIL